MALAYLTSLDDNNYIVNKKNLIKQVFFLKGSFIFILLLYKFFVDVWYKILYILVLGGVFLIIQRSDQSMMTYISI